MDRQKSFFFGKLFKLVRNNKNLSQNDIAGKSLDRSLFSRIENGLNEPSLVTLVHFLNTAELSLEELLGTEEAQQLETPYREYAVTRYYVSHFLKCMLRYDFGTGRYLLNYLKAEHDDTGYSEFVEMWLALEHAQAEQKWSKKANDWYRYYLKITIFSDIDLLAVLVICHYVSIDQLERLYRHIAAAQKKMYSYTVNRYALEALFIEEYLYQLIISKQYGKANETIHKLNPRVVKNVAHIRIMLLIYSGVIILASHEREKPKALQHIVRGLEMLQFQQQEYRYERMNDLVSRVIGHGDLY